MYDFFLILAGLGLLLQIGGFAHYHYRLFITKHAKPHFFSWFAWALLAGIGFFAQLSEEEFWRTLPLFAIFLHCSIVAIAALFVGEKAITPFDWKIFGLTLLAIPLWLFTETPLYSVILITIVEALAWIPTVRKTWKKPGSEPLYSFTFSAFSYLTGLFLLQEITVVTALYQCAMVVMNWSFVGMVVWRRGIFKKISSKLQKKFL